MFTGETGAFIVMIMIKFLMYANDIRITLDMDETPGIWNGINYDISASNTKWALNTNFALVIVSFFVCVTQLKVEKNI